MREQSLRRPNKKTYTIFGLFNYPIPWTYHKNGPTTNESVNIIFKVKIF